MESERRYTTVSMDAHFYQKVQRNITAGEFYDSLKNNINGKEKKEEVKEEKNKDKGTTMGNGENSLMYLKGKFSELSKISEARNIRNDSEMLNKFRASLIMYILKLLMGDKVKDFYDVQSVSGVGFAETTTTDTYVQYYREEETTSYKAAGKVVTEDGKEIDIGIDITMSRSFEEYIEATSESTNVGQILMDPLVINFDGNLADVKDQKFCFDLNSDGISDNVAKLSKGSGFLSLDLNEDGIINDGGELFGTKSGDGFKDLLAYDSDKNGWIDENDEVYDKLKIMVVNDDGSQSLYTLKEKDVGAIYLGNASTDFLVTNNTNNVNAAIRKTGLFLYENGSAGTIQHVDLAVELGA